MNNKFSLNGKYAGSSDRNAITNNVFGNSFQNYDTNIEHTKNYLLNCVTDHMNELKFTMERNIVAAIDERFQLNNQGILQMIDFKIDQLKNTFETTFNNDKINIDELDIPLISFSRFKESVNKHISVLVPEALENFAYLKALSKIVLKIKTTGDKYDIPYYFKSSEDLCHGTLMYFNQACTTYSREKRKSDIPRLENETDSNFNARCAFIEVCHIQWLLFLKDLRKNKAISSLFNGNCWLLILFFKSCIFYVTIKGRVRLIHFNSQMHQMDSKW
jgi:hypothetical protein